MTDTHDPFTHSLHEKVLHSELLHTYQQAFRCATGLPLKFAKPDASVCDLLTDQENGSPFCQKLNVCQSACSACIDVNRRLVAEAAINGPSSCKCFTGISASAVPVFCGVTLIGMLRTGHIFHQIPEPKDFDKVAKTLSRQGLNDDDIEKLRAAYFQTRVVEPERYQSMLTLLANFGEQLGKFAEKLTIVSESREPEAVARARNFIEKTLADPLPLPLVAKHAGLSESHFCRVFKESTGLTLTDYINRRRIEWAKRELLKPQARVSEIAFHIGYQSLSQFNRSFVRFTGNSPSNFRREELSKLAAS